MTPRPRDADRDADPASQLPDMRVMRPSCHSRLLIIEHFWWFLGRPVDTTRRLCMGPVDRKASKPPKIAQSWTAFKSKKKKTTRSLESWTHRMVDSQKNESPKSRVPSVPRPNSRDLVSRTVEAAILEWRKIMPVSRDTQHTNSGSGRAAECRGLGCTYRADYMPNIGRRKKRKKGRK